MKTHRLVPALVAALLLAAPLAAQPPDRSAPPQTGPAPTLNLPAIHKYTLSNGLAVWVAELHKVPIVQVSLVVLAGAGADPAGRFGVASLTAAMLDEGAGARSSLEIADAIDYLGASLSTSSSFDASVVDLWVPVARLGDALPIMADVATRPTFPAEELSRLQKERLTSLLQARDDPRSIAGLAFPRLIYGPQHRYGTAAMGTPQTVAALAPENLRSFYTTHYAPRNAALIVVGDIKSDEVVPLLESAFGSWAPGGQMAVVEPLPNAPQLFKRQVFLVDKPGAAQSQITIGWIGVARSTPDYFTLEVLNTILGGSFTSRLNQNLRERHGYTYGAGSGFDMRTAAGPFRASASVDTNKTAEALTEFFVELNGILKPVSPDELTRAKNYVALGFPGQFETAGDIASHLEAVVVYRLPDDYFSSYVSSIQSVTADAVRLAAQKYIQPSRFAVVVVGDRAAIEAKVKALDLGPLKLMTIDDALGPARQP